MSDVRVNLLKGQRGFFIEVCVKSEAKKNARGTVWLTARVQIDRNVEKNVQFTAGALAVQQNLENGDNHDPSAVAKAAREAFKAAMLGYATNTTFIA